MEEAHRSPDSSRKVVREKGSPLSPSLTPPHTLCSQDGERRAKSKSVPKFYEGEREEEPPCATEAKAAELRASCFELAENRYYFLF